MQTLLSALAWIAQQPKALPEGQTPQGGTCFDVTHQVEAESRSSHNSAVVLVRLSCCHCHMASADIPALATGDSAYTMPNVSPGMQTVADDAASESGSNQQAALPFYRQHF